MSLAQDLEIHGLYLRGITKLSAEEIKTYQFSGEHDSIALVGNIGSSYWSLFSQSAEYLDATANPLDRWSRRIADEIGSKHPVQPIFPFDGPPYYPFLQWARRAEALAQSPLGMMIHAEYGLWHSYRFALLIDSADSEPTVAEAESPCLSCEAQPCLHSCPVDAFDADGYDVERCAAFLNQTPQAGCHSHGCLARYACPVAGEYRYDSAQSQFHLRAFLNLRPRLS